MPTRSRKYLRTIKKELCTCGLGKIFIAVSCDATPGGAWLDPVMIRTICPHCGKGGGRWPMDEREVEKAKSLIAKIDKERKAELKSEFEQEN